MKLKPLPVEIWSMILKFKYRNFVIDVYNCLYYIHCLRMQDVMTEIKAYFYELEYCNLKHGENSTFMRHRMAVALPKLNIQTVKFFYYVEEWI